MSRICNLITLIFWVFSLLISPLLIFPLLIFTKPLYAEVVECKVALEALNEASEIRKLSVKKTVPCLVQSKMEVEQYLLSIIEEQLPPSKLKNEEIIYKRIGLLPQDFDYKKGIVDLYLSQLGGYYDPEKNRFIMAGWLPAKLQNGIAAHELTHALQDQYYDLKKFIDPLTQNGDTVLAHSALVEGDATAVMYDYDRKRGGQPPLSKTPSISSLLLANIGASMPNNGKIPKSLQMILIFPYTGGFNFVHQILIKEGYEGLSKIYANPPDTTEEVIHIEKYLAGKKDYIEYSDADLRGGIPEDYKLIYRDTIGEFGITALLSMLSLPQTEIQNASEGWGGDAIALFSNGSKKILVWKINWDSKKDLDEFKDAYNASIFNVKVNGLMLELRTDL